MANELGTRVLPKGKEESGWRWFMLAIVWSVQTSVAMTMQATGPIAPFIQGDLYISRAEVGGLLSAFSIGSMIITLPAGWFADRFGVRIPLSVGPAIAGFGLFAASRMPSYSMMMVVMLLAGCGVGIVSPSATKAVMTWFSAAQRGTAMGFKQTGTSVGGAIAAAVLPPLAILIGWRDGMALAGLAAATMGAVCYLSYHDHRSRKAATKSSELGAFRQEFSSRIVQLSCFSGFCFSAVQLTVATHLVLYLTEAIGMKDIAAAGELLALAQMAGVVARIVLGYSSDRLFGGRRKGLLMFTGVGSTVCAVMTALAAPVLPFGGLVALIAAFGFLGIGWTGLFVTMMAELSPRSIGARSAVGLFACNFGIVIGPPFFGWVVDVSHSYPLGWAVVAATAAAGVLALRPVRERTR